MGRMGDGDGRRGGRRNWGLYVKLKLFFNTMNESSLEGRGLLHFKFLANWGSIDNTLNITSYCHCSGYNLDFDN